MVTIRNARLSELPEIAKMGTELVAYHQKYGEYVKSDKDNLKTFKKFFKSCIHAPNKLLLVAEDGNKLIGYCLGWPMKRPPVYKIKKVGYVSDVYVRTAYRRKGIAKVLLKEMHAWFKSKGLEYAELTVVSDNEAGVNAWKKYGYKEYMIRKYRKLR